MGMTLRQQLLASTLLMGAAAVPAPALAHAGGEPGKSDTVATAGSNIVAEQPSTGATTDGAVKAPTQEPTLGGANADVSREEAQSRTITVTGSRIARPDLTSTSPVTVVNAEQIQLTGTTTLETLLNDLPEVIPGNTRVSNNAGGQSFATLDLRGLGPGRTLILLDGERLAPSSTNGVVDISQIPTGLIQRVDVVTGGASAVYGSDAVAGVINFVLKKDFSGLEVTGQTGIAENGLGFSYNVSGMFGKNFADGKGNITVYGAYYTRDAVSQNQLDYSRVSGALIYDGTTSRLVDNPANLPPTGSFSVLSGGGSATAPQGTITTNTSSNPFRNLNTLLPATFANADTDCDPTTPGTSSGSGGGTLSFNRQGQLTPFFSSGRCTVPTGTSERYNFAPANLLVTPYDRLNFSAVGHYDFTDSTRGSFLASYTHANQTVNLAPTPATGIVVPANAPFIPADLQIALNSRPQPNAPFTLNRRFTETGPRIGIFNTSSFNLRGGLEHDLSSDWHVSGVLSYARVDNTSRGIGNINKTAVSQGLNGCRDASGVVNGIGILPGCTTLHIFGENSLTANELKFIEVDTITLQSFDETRAAANINGTLLRLPGGPLGVAMGVEYRRDRAESNPDQELRSGNIYGFNAVSPLKGAISVKEVYGELRAPILGGPGKFPNLLSFEVGGRYSQYSTIGGLFNWKAGVEFAPLSWMRFRGMYNKAARAPNVFELFRAGDQGFGNYIDPCNSNNTSRNVAQCLATGVPAGDIGTFNQINSQVQSFAFGNPNLSAEKAETYTAGVVLSPNTFVFNTKASMTVDYYRINLTNRISSLGTSFFLPQCYTMNDPTACARIVRDPATGQIVSINTTVTNSSTPLLLSGIDVGLNWMIPLGGMFGDGAKLRISDLFSYTEHYRLGTKATGLADYADTTFAGIGGTIPRYANTLTVAYETKAFTAQARWVWKRGGRQNFPGADIPQSFYKAGDPTRVPDLSFVDLSLRWNVSDRFVLTGIVNNIFNRFPPHTPSGFFEQANTNVSFYDPIALGRNYAVQATIRF